MPACITPEKISVVLLYNVDPKWTQEEKNEVIQLTNELGDALQNIGYPIVTVAIEDDNLAAHLQPFDPGKYIIFNWCESLPGIKHSEWLVAKKLEMLGYTFTGADSNALALAQDKQMVKVTLSKASIPTPVWRIFSSPDVGDWKIFPAIVKPQNEHCSEGISTESVVMNQTDLKNRISFILDKYSQQALVEDFIDGREFHVSVWGNEKLTILPAAEMDYSCFSSLKDRICTYEAKFIPGSKHYEEIKTLVPASLSPDEKKAIEKICEDAYRAMSCRDYARMDIRLRDNVFYVLDVNPNADICSDASMVSAAGVNGITYAQVGSRIVQMAAQRHPVFGKMANNSIPSAKN